MIAVADLGAFLQGEWAVTRCMTSADGSALGSFDGTVTFLGPLPTLAYVERGTLHLPTSSNPAHRDLEYRIVSATAAEVYFDHGGFFHYVDLATGEWDVVHPCSADMYAGRYEVTSADEFAQLWQVRGPQKDYSIHTQFRRAGG